MRDYYLLVAIAVVMKGIAAVPAHDTGSMQLFPTKATAAHVGVQTSLHARGGYQFADRTALKTAVDAWIADEPAATAKYGDINTWDVSLVTSMSGLFSDSDFNSDISNWNVGRVTNMGYMFDNCKSFNQDISQWDVSSVRTTEQMFCRAYAFNQDISQWDVSSVIRVSNMFYQAYAFDHVLCWDIPYMTDQVDDDIVTGGYGYGDGNLIESDRESMFDKSPGRLCDDRDYELKRMKSENAELRAIVNNVQGWKQKVRHGTDKLSTHKTSHGPKHAHGHLRGSDEADRV